MKHGRLIDADALKELLQAWKCVAQERGAEINNMFASAIIAQVDAMPTIEPEPQWRPCSEPPEEDGVYIVYAPTYSGGSSSAKECHNGVMFSKYKNGKWSIEHGYYSRPNCVKAWKPLDEPCRGEGEPK